MIREFLSRSPLRRLGTIAAIVGVLEIMTGPSGSIDTPTSGFSGSFAEPASFFGLFRGQRWMIFAVFVLVIWGLASYWHENGHRVRQTVSRVMAAPKMISEKKQVRWGFLLALLALAIAMPHLETDPFWQAAMVEQIGVYILLAIGLNVVVGFAGLLDLGYVAFYAIGAYSTAWVTGALPLPAPFGHPLNAFFAIPIAIALVMVAGVLLGAPTLRLRGDYLAIVTLGFGEIVTIFANNLYGITGGSLGSNYIPHPSIDLGPIKYVWGLAPVPYYYLIVGFIVIFIVVFSMLEHSRVGRAWTAIREDEVAAESVGINPLKYKVMAFAIGAASAGFAGVITASQTNKIFPQSFTLQFSINILVLVILGGMGSIAGVILGALIVQIASAYLLHNPPMGYQTSDLYIYLGALLITMMIVRPAGLIPSRRRKREITLFEGSGEGHLNEVLSGDDIDD